MLRCTHQAIGATSSVYKSAVAATSVNGGFANTEIANHQGKNSSGKIRKIRKEMKVCMHRLIFGADVSSSICSYCSITYPTSELRCSSGCHSDDHYCFPLSLVGVVNT